MSEGVKEWSECARRTAWCCFTALGLHRTVLNRVSRFLSASASTTASASVMSDLSYAVNTDDRCLLLPLTVSAANATTQMLALLMMQSHTHADTHLTGIDRHIHTKYRHTDTQTHKTQTRLCSLLSLFCFPFLVSAVLSSCGGNRSRTSAGTSFPKET